MKNLPNLLILLSCSLTLAGCEQATQADATSPANAPAEEAAVAQVNGRPISEKAFEAYLEVKRIPKDDEKRKARALDDYVQREALTDVILQQKLLPEDKIAAEVAEFRKQMVISRYFESYLRDKVTEQAIRNFYAAHPERFQSRKVHVAHVLIRTNPKMGPTEKQALLNKAQEVYGRAMAQEDFATLAGTYSDDIMSAKKGGDLGWIQEGAIDPAFSKAAFELKQGEVSQPVATPFGFHVMKVIEAAQVVKQPYEKVKGDIRFELRQQAKKAEMGRLEGLTKVTIESGDKDKG